MPMPLVEALCTVIVVVYIGLRVRATPSPRPFLTRFAAAAVAALLSENTCIELYGFYAYSREWSVFVGEVPLLVGLIWPCVIDSAWEIARHLRPPDRPTTVLLAAAIVLADASLIEPIAVRADLWRWSEPGFLDVPPIGVIGWALFALASLALFQANDRHGRGAAWDWLVVLIAPAFTHLTLLTGWWGGLRWLNAEVPWPPTLVLVWIASAALTTGISLRPWGARVPRPTMLLRVAPALFFFVLLATQEDATPLWLHALAFAPPYVALTLRAPKSRRSH